MIKNRRVVEYIPDSGTFQVTRFQIFQWYVLKRKFLEVELLLTDTDRQLVKFQSSDLVGDMEEIGTYLDFSKNPPGHPLYSAENKGIPGKFKDQTMEGI